MDSRVIEPVARGCRAEGARIEHRACILCTVRPGEAAAWRASLPRRENALSLADLSGDAHVTLEERIPYYSKRINAFTSDITSMAGRRRSSWN